MKNQINGIRAIAIIILILNALFFALTLLSGPTLGAYLRVQGSKLETNAANLPAVSRDQVTEVADQISFVANGYNRQLKILLIVQFANVVLSALLVRMSFFEPLVPSPGLRGVKTD